MKVPIEYMNEYAIVRGGLHGRPSGSVAGIIYGGARSRIGKVVTARELVFPANPRTPDQLLQRRKFKQALFATRHLAAALWQGYFNRAIGQLPGFQSMMSIILDNTDDAEELTVPPDTPLGNLHFPDTFGIAAGPTIIGSVTATWTAELGLNGTADDLFRIFAVSVLPEDTEERGTAVEIGTTKRSELELELTLPEAGFDYVFGSFFEGTGAAEGILSPCPYEIQTAFIP
ncbi:hypothetical protein ES708_19247 [subsurface metagenome]